MPRKFQRTIEDFVCDNCGTATRGNGYTDHCPKCLWSKHVDINPGDREADCGGLMEPVAVEFKNKECIIDYKCTKCGYKHRVKSASEDSLDEMLKLL